MTNIYRNNAAPEPFVQVIAGVRYIDGCPVDYDVSIPGHLGIIVRNYKDLERVKSAVNQQFKTKDYGFLTVSVEAKPIKILGFRIW